VHTAEGIINFVFITTLTTEKLHVLHVIGMQNTSVVRRGNMTVLMI